MIAHLARQYPLKLMLDLLIKVAKSKAKWWIVDPQGVLLYSNSHSSIVEGRRWEIVIGEHYGSLISSQKGHALLNEIIQQLLTLLIQIELQRQADNHWRDSIQEQLQLHQRYRPLFGMINKRPAISEMVLRESRLLSNAKTALLYVRTHTGLYVLDAHHGNKLFGKTPPFRLPEGLMQLAIERKENQWQNDLSTNYHASSTERNAQNALIVPLQALTKVWGVLALFDQSEAFSAAQVQQVQILADYAALAYYNAAAIQQLLLQERRPLQESDNDAEWDEVFEHSDLDWHDVQEPSNPNSTTKGYRIDNS